MFEQLLRSWDGEHAVIRHDASSGAWIFVCVHSTVLGPAGGGTRMRVYPTPADGLADASQTQFAAGESRDRATEPAHPASAGASATAAGHEVER